MDPLTLLRFALARPSLEAARDMFVDTMGWRARTNLNDLYAELHPARPPATSRAELAAAHFYGGLGGTTRSGLPFFVERLGRLDLGGMARDDSVREAVVSAYTAYLEGILRLDRACSTAQGKLVRSLLIIDMAGAGFSSIRHVSLLQANSKLAVANYPELYAPILIVNAPGIVAGAWGLFKPLIPLETRRKISIVSASSTLETLEKHISIDQIPHFLGGEATERPSTMPPWPRSEPVPK
jgi:hypothetical protein